MTSARLVTSWSQLGQEELTPPPRPPHGVHLRLRVRVAPSLRGGHGHEYMLYSRRRLRGDSSRSAIASPGYPVLLTSKTWVLRGLLGYNHGWGSSRMSTCPPLHQPLLLCLALRLLSLALLLALSLQKYNPQMVAGAVVDRSAAIRPPPMMEPKGEYPDRLSLSLHLHHPSRAVTAPPFGTTLATSGVHHHTLPMGMGAPLHLTSMITTAINMLGLVPGGDCPDVARATMCAQQTSTTASPSMASML